MVQRALELLGYYEPKGETAYGVFDDNTFDAAVSFNILMSTSENGEVVFDNTSFNILFSDVYDDCAYG